MGRWPGTEHVERGHWSSESRYSIFRVDLDLLMTSGYASLCEQSHLCKATGASHGLLKIPWHQGGSSGFVQLEGAVSTHEVLYKRLGPSQLPQGWPAGGAGQTQLPGTGSGSSGSWGVRVQGREGAVDGGYRRNAGFAGSACIFPCTFNILPCQVMAW